jgi:hypothetical protein
MSYLSCLVPKCPDMGQDGRMGEAQRATDRSAAAEFWTVREIADARGVTVSTVRSDGYQHPGRWPQPAGRRHGRARPEFEFDAAQIRAFYEWKDSIPRGRRPRGSYPAEDWVTSEEAARRLGVSWNTFRTYPSVYRKTANPLPVPNRSGQYNWGQLVAWDDRRRPPRRGRRRS